MAAAQTLGVLVLPAALIVCYLHSDSLAGRDAIGPNPESMTCLCKLHLNSGAKGTTVFESVYRPHSFTGP